MLYNWMERQQVRRMCPNNIQEYCTMLQRKRYKYLLLFLSSKSGIHDL